MKVNLWTEFFLLSWCLVTVQFIDGLNYVCNFLSGSLTFQVCKPTHQQSLINGRAILQGAMKIDVAFQCNKNTTKHASVLRNTKVPHLVIKKKKKNNIIRVVRMPDTYYRELFYPFSPIFQMFYYLETGQLFKLVIEAHLFQGAHLQAIGSI